MKREVELSEISDGRRYGRNDMVKADCGDCKGCSACCRGMGTSVVLDPLDVWRLKKHLSCTFEELLQDKLQLNMVDGVILPNLNMSKENEQCGFLDENGRCKIHAFRPGICRMFPLGRVYEEQGFWYFLQTHECKKENRAKVKVHKWIDTPDVKRYEKFVLDWHNFLKRLEQRIKEEGTKEFAQKVSMYVLKQFYILPFNEEEDFYEQLGKRLEAASCI